MVNVFGVGFLCLIAIVGIGYGIALIVRRRAFAELGRRAQRRVWGETAARMVPDWMPIAVGVGMIGVAILALILLPTVWFLE